MKKGSIITVTTVIVVAALAVGGYALFHKTSKPASPVSASGSTSTTNSDVLVTKTSSSLGQYLAEPGGQPLYTFGGDSNGVSNCTGSCLASWPAYQAKGTTANLPTGVGTIKRTDNGETQFTYNGMPLYTFTGDTNGNVTGNGVENFTVAKPAAAAATPSSSSSAGSPSAPAAPAPAASSNSSSSSYGSGW
ncbi:MAG TPA: hypothetical protein VGM08_03790 [Candidatus Saccharimonadales bacterium]|jgi:predicted lipoprotein with Yx(FWY)xxD motif